MSFLFKLSTIKLRHTKDGIEMVSSEATLSQIPTLNKYNFKTEISTTFEAFQSGKMSLDFNNDILNVDLDLDLEWNSLNKRGAKLTYEVASLSIYIVGIEKVFFRTMDSNGMILFDLLKPKKEVLLFNSDIFLELFHYKRK